MSLEKLEEHGGAGFRNGQRNRAQMMLKASELSQRLLRFGKDLFLRREQQLETS